MNLSTRIVLLLILILIAFGQDPITAQNYRNASDVENPQPLAGLKHIRSSQEIYIGWAEDNFFKNQLIDYFPTPQADASLLAGDITDVFAPSVVEGGNEDNSTTRSAAVAADMNNDGVDEIIRLSTTSSFDLLLSATEIGSELMVTGNSVSTNIPAQVSTNIRSKVMLFAGNFDGDVGDEIVCIWSEGDASLIKVVQIAVYGLKNGQMTQMTTYTLPGNFILYDAVMSDTDLDGLSDVHIATFNSDLSLTISSLGMPDSISLSERAQLNIEEFTPSIPLERDLSLSLTAGDYNGDVAPELALFLRQADASEGSQKVHLRLIQSVDRTSTSDIDLFEELLVIDQMIIQDTTLEFLDDYLPLESASGDLDGDGDDDLILFTHLRNLFLQLSVDTMGFISSMLELEGGLIDDGIVCFTRGGSATVDMHIDDLNRDGIDEFIFVEAEGCTEDIISDNMRGARLAVDVYDLSADTAVLTGTYNSNESNTSFLGVLAADFVLGDFNGDNYRLGQGHYFRKSELSQPIIMLNAPPIHFDQLNGNSFDINGCYYGEECSFTSTYSVSTTMSALTSTTLTSSWGVSATVEGEVSANAGVVKSSVEGSVTARYGEKFSKYNRSGQRLEISTQVRAAEDDQIYATVTDYDIWEYPVMENDTIVAHLVSVTPSLIERRWFPSKSYNAFDFLPDHEVGNILSYREKKPSLSAAARNISSDEFTLSANTLNKWTVNQQSFNESGSSFEREIGLEASATIETEAQFKVFGGRLSTTLEGEYESSQLSTQKTRISEEVEIEVELGGINESLGEVKYAVQPYCYWAKNGALVVDYTAQPEVPAPGASDTWWSEHYGNKADPALVLPWRYDPEKGFTLQEEEIKRYQSKSIAFSDSRPDPGDTITIYLEVHNWSLLPTTEPVEAGFYVCDPTDEQNRLASADGVATISTENILEPRGNDILSFRWVVPEDLPTFPRIYARLDPNSLEDEIHEDNNYGFNILNMSTNQAPCPDAVITNSKYTTISGHDLKVYPNPTTESIFIESDDGLVGPATIHILDELGRKVMSKSQEMIDRREISVSHLQSGFYYYTLEMGKHAYSGKFIKL